MAVTTKKSFAATSNATTTVFSPVSIQLNNQDDLDVYVTLSGGTRVLQLRQSTGSTAQSSHPQVSNTDGLYFPAVSAGTTLYNYTLSSDNNTITFNSALPSGAVVFVSVGQEMQIVHILALLVAVQLELLTLTTHLLNLTLQHRMLEIRHLI